MFYDGTKYFYQLNLQGDVIGIIDTTGASVAKYAYDAWGKVVYSTGSMAAINPIRYRGYYYDAELGMYYLQSRYYDPALKRFINEDSYASTGYGFLGMNAFSYCINNPVNCSDPYGDIVIADDVVYLVALFSIVIYGTIVASPAGQEATAGVVDAVEDIIVGINRGITQHSSSSPAKVKIETALDKSFASIGTERRYRNQRELHHIVAQRAPNAALARTILRKVGIGYNSSVNLVSLKTGLHRRLHTNMYYGWANSVVISAYRSAGSNIFRQKERVLQALRTIRTYLLVLDALAPY